ncbi:MAG: transglutaminase-like domain-containing protein [Bacteroidales bacterium]
MKFRMLICILLLMGVCSCRSTSDYDVSEQTLKDLTAKVELLKTADSASGAVKLAARIESDLLNGAPLKGVSEEELESLRFLFAYMPLNDLAEKSFDYFVQTVKQAYATKALPWGAKINDELFRHFVLPPRVNNEVLDNAREVFARELIPRIKNLSMYDAVIEVNHWCREKIVYQPTDGRTTPPEQTVNRAYGRCGEESTVAVAALRSVGIPSRQVYVPRWAHTNSNHAWVEVWVDGQWYYLGACEPEPLLDRGWFTASASRAMLVNTYAYGPLNPAKDSQNKGEVISQNTCFTEVSNTSTYAPVKKAVVKVVDGSNNPLKDAFVRFQIFNGNSLFSLADRRTSDDGIAYLTTGLGTFIIEAYSKQGDKELYAARLYSVPKQDTLTIVMERDERLGGQDGQPAVADFRITPPAETRFPVSLEADVQKAHDVRCALDDSLRLAHIATFRFSDINQAKEVSASMVKAGLPAAMEGKLTELLSQTLSNGFEVEKFLKLTEPEHLPLAVQLLETVRIKDLQEISADIFKEYLFGVTRLGSVYTGDEIFRQTILNPRFGNEIPWGYKSQLWDVLTENGMMAPGGNKETIEAVTKALGKITLVLGEQMNPRNYTIAPIAVESFGMADAAAYAMYARALFHTAGIPTRLNTLNGSLQIFMKGKWEPYKLLSEKEIVPACFQGKAVLNIENAQGEKSDRRYNLLRWVDHGYRSVGGVNRMDPDEADAFKENCEVEPGFYRVLTGIRAADGSILARMKTFAVQPNSKQSIAAEYAPVEEDELIVIGTMDAEWKYSAKSDQAETQPVSILQTVGRNFFMLAFVEPTKEPSQHFIRELSQIADAIKIPTVIMFHNKDLMDFFFKQSYKLSDKINYGFDSESVILKGLEASLKAEHLDVRLPVVVVADSFGNIYYKSIGYSIGIPDTVSKLKLP